MNKKMMSMLVLLMVVIAGCGNNQAKENQPEQGKENTPTKTEATLKVATLIPPMTEILDVVKPLLKEEGINLEVVVLSDNVQPNDALANKEVDANFFQHVPYMKQYNENKHTELVPIQPIYNAIYGAYSKRYKTMEELPEGATIAIANDPTNIGRSLVMLDKAGIIKIKEGVGIQATQGDIIENKKKFKFEEVDLLMLARMLDDADLVLMTPAYASPLGLTPKKDALLTETDDSEFVITLVARADNQDSEIIQKLAKVMSGPEVKKFLEENYDEIAVPAFK
ncbi:D-methionine transport system substrate-binding protein [Paenibacillus anaericanus]|uniref:MetQ/NlpA family ABC transporter substrate-binding protein n=1 Tax=Paenibacillus anaericanus TaxID=170367 RepID=UPI002785A624|nr:MetQ/NlpA family ABC transporter substrate-binding protein [Paenibacillus anaericanus]MDQ0087514.1 D-methionine transport system substrate-binding protein [Paenibacillus anaericanus]